MTKLTLEAQPLTKQAFAIFGDVIEMQDQQADHMNDATIAQYQNLAEVKVDTDRGGKAVVSLAKARTITPLPLQLAMVERHPHGSQMFFPLFDDPMLVVVAPATEQLNVTDLQAFISNGQQGINYHQNVWHMPMIASKVGQQWLIVDRHGPGENCDECLLDQHQITVTV